MQILKWKHLWLAIFLIITPVFGQAESLQGKIVDLETDAGISCPVYFYSGECASNYFGMQWPDSNGYFQMDNLPDDIAIYIKLIPGNAGLTSYMTQYYDGALTCGEDRKSVV